MKYLLDTNICVYFLNGKFGIHEKLKQVGSANCAISEITLAEIVFGAENSANPQTNLKHIEDLTEMISVLPIIEAIFLYGKEKARLRKAGTPISDFDLLIGTTSVVHDMIMVTNNTKEFERIKNIQLENWLYQ